MPMELVWAHVEMLPVLTAEERTGEVSVAAIGRFMKHGSWASSVFREWKNAIRNAGYSRPKKATVKGLAAIGISVKGAPRG